MKLGSNCKISGLRIDFCTLVLVEAWFHCFILRRIRREEVNCNQGISCTVTTNSHVNYNQNCELSFMIYFVIIYSGPASSLKRTLTDAAGPTCSSISKDHSHQTEYSHTSQQTQKSPLGSTLNFVMLWLWVCQ